MNLDPQYQPLLTQLKKCQICGGKLQPREVAEGFCDECLRANVWPNLKEVK